MTSVGTSLESGNPLGDRGLLPLCHKGEIHRDSWSIRLAEELGMTMRIACRTSFTSPCRSLDREAADQSP